MTDDIDARFDDIVAKRRDGTLIAGIITAVCLVLATLLHVWQQSFVGSAAAAGLQRWVGPLTTALAITGGVLGGLAVWERITGPRAATSEESRGRAARRLLWVGVGLVAVFVLWTVVDTLFLFAAISDPTAGNPGPVLQWLSLALYWVPMVLLQLGLTLVALSLWARWSTSLP